MNPLLRIQTVPINIQMRTTRPQLIQSNEQPRPQAQMSRQPGSVSTNITQPQVNIDTLEARASAGLRSSARFISDTADAGNRTALQATATFVAEGNQLQDAHGQGQPIIDIALQRTMRTLDTITAHIPSAPPEFDARMGDVQFDYSMEQIYFDWSQMRAQAQMEFIPGAVEFDVLELPQVIIEFIGGPIYVPPSSDPNYQPAYL